jgi:hypothetical protein
VLSALCPSLAGRRRIAEQEDLMDPLVKAVRMLTIAVWCLCVLIALQVVVYAASYFRASSLLGKYGAGGPVTTTTTSSGPLPREPDAAGKAFHDLPPEQMVAKASAILLVSYQPDGERMKAVVAEVLKKEPDVVLHYGPGDELRYLSYYPKAGETRGEGQVVFMVGSPAEMRSSFSFDAGRIGGFGDMPLESLRRLVKGAKG